MFIRSTKDKANLENRGVLWFIIIVINNYFSFFFFPPKGLSNGKNQWGLENKEPQVDGFLYIWGVPNAADNCIYQ